MRQIFGNCIYTIKLGPALDQLLATGVQKGQFSERKAWRQGQKLLLEAQATQKVMPILFSPADQDAGVRYVALLTDIQIDDAITHYSFDQLVKLTSDYPRSKLRKLSDGLPLADQFIRNYAICFTPPRAECWFNPTLAYPDEELDSATFREGRHMRILVNAYERNSAARSRCLQHYGTSCAVCNLNFEQRYGEIGQGFIHVHHKTSIASINHEYELDPIRDLIPVCPNCHAMLHRTNPPLTIEELQQQLRKMAS